MSALTNKKTYRNYSINTGKNGEYTCNTRTLDQGIDRLEYMIARHSKVQCCRLDIRLPVEMITNIRPVMTRVLEKTSRKLKSDYRKSPHQVDMHYVWRAERGSSKNEHVHLFIMLNGNAIHNGWKAQKVVNENLKAHLHTEKNGLVNFSKSNGEYGMQIVRNSPDFDEMMNKTVYAMSYLAKIKVDEPKPKNGRISSASRLPH